MTPYFKLITVVAFLMLTASAMAGAKYEPISNTEIMKEALLEAEIKALTSLKEVEKAINLKLKQRMMGDEECSPPGHICSGFGPPDQCCSGSCVPHPRLRIFVCA